MRIRKKCELRERNGSGLYENKIVLGILREKKQFKKYHSSLISIIENVTHSSASCKYIYKARLKNQLGTYQFGNCKSSQLINEIKHLIFYKKILFNIILLVAI